MKTTFAGVIALVVVGVALYFWGNRGAGVVKVPQEDTFLSQGKNASFMVDEELVTLVNGVSEVPAAPGSATKVVTRYFGNEATGDVNDDGLEDFAFLVTRDTGGTGLFYYAVVILQVPGGFKATNAFLVGDRIAPQSTDIPSDARELRVNFVERKQGEPMSARPSVGVTLYLKVTPEGVLEGLMK